MSQPPSNTAFDFQYYLGFDWAQDHHDVVVLDRQGTLVYQARFSNDAEGWSRLAADLARFPQLAATLETSAGSVVERLLALGLALFPVHPKAAQRYRDRKAPCGTKTDFLDAWSLADALRTDGHGWRALKPLDPLLQELRLLCRDEVGLIEQRTALINQLRQALHEYYPAALEAFDNWTMPAAWALIERYPTPQTLIAAGPRRHVSFLKKHGLTDSRTYPQRLAVFARADQFQGPPPVVAAKSRLALALVGQLRTLQVQIQLYRDRILQLFEQHPDHDLFGSLPGAGPKLAPRLLAECGDDRDRFETPQSLACYAGTAPVSFQSGQIHKVRFRRACNPSLRAAVHLWSNLSRRSCAWAEAYYQLKRHQGKSHACALRCLGQRWLKILWKMWQTRTTYNEALHNRNQTSHGSCVLELVEPALT